MRVRTIILVALLLAIGAVAHAGDYYKWKDVHGTVHYSQTPPPDRASREVWVSDHAPTPPLMETGKQTSAQKIKSDAQATTLQTANTQAVAANCATARKNIATLQSRKTVGNPQDPGEVRALTPGQREQELTQAQTQATKFCAHNPR